MRRRVLAGFITLVMAGGTLVLATAGPAEAIVCSVEQVTDTAGSANGQPAISDAANRIVFTSTEDLTGDNPDESQEVFLLDRNTEEFTQLSGVPVLQQAGTGREPSISGDGDQVVFDSSADGNFDIYLYDVSAASLTNLTNTATPRINRTASISNDGSRIAFASNADLTPSGTLTNADLSEELFLRNSNGTLTQLTTSTGGGTSTPDLDADGSRIAFQSNRDLVGTNADLNLEVFMWVEGATPAITQLTQTTGTAITNSAAAINGDGSRVVFQSTADINGQNVHNDQEVYLLEVTTPPAPPSIAQALTSGEGNTTLPDISADGFRIVAASDKDLIAGENTDLSEESFIFDLNLPETVQATSSPDNISATEASITSDGTRMAFRGAGDFTGHNADGNTEIFVTTCGRVGPTFTDYPMGSTFYDQVEWMAAGEIASGFPDGTFRPQDFVKRQQMANFLFNMAGEPPFTPPNNANRSFTDYPVGSTFYHEVEWMAFEEIASGFPDGTFRPQDFVKRQQMANFLYNLAGQPSFTPPDNSNRTFTDYPSTSTYYLQVEWMAAEEIASGFPDGTFRPQDFVKRQQMANFLHNLARGPGVDLA